jgi:phosphatidate cytidylyltransferase
MKTVWIIYIVILVYYLLGTVGIFFINRRKEPQIKRKAWIKHVNYFVITNLVFFSIAVNPVIFRYVAALIIIVGFYELFKLYRGSGFSHTGFFLASIIILASLSFGFYSFSLMDKGLILFAFLIIAIFDGFSQVSGQLLGRTKLFPKISPNKTGNNSGSCSCCLCFSWRYCEISLQKKIQCKGLQQPYSGTRRFP